MTADVPMTWRLEGYEGSKRVVSCDITPPSLGQQDGLGFVASLIAEREELKATLATAQDAAADLLTRTEEAVALRAERDDIQKQWEELHVEWALTSGALCDAGWAVDEMHVGVKLLAADLDEARAQRDDLMAANRAIYADLEAERMTTKDALAQRDALKAGASALVDALMAFKRDDTPAAYNALNTPLLALHALLVGP